MAMVYKWKPYGHQFGIPAQVAGEELERLRASKNGNLIAADVVRSAKSATSPLHKAFEWDDKKAAHHWRLSQASDLIRAVVVVAVNADGQQVPMRAFVNVGTGEERGYTSLQIAMADDAMRAQLIARAWDELEDWRERHKELTEFKDVFDAIDSQQQKHRAAA